jgi:hypothetical protein
LTQVASSTATFERGGYNPFTHAMSSRIRGGTNPPPRPNSMK